MSIHEHQDGLDQPNDHIDGALKPISAMEYRALPTRFLSSLREVLRF